MMAVANDRKNAIATILLEGRNDIATLHFLLLPLSAGAPL